MSTDATLPAGSFGAWLAQFRASLRGEGGNDVPCGECVGCCVSSYYIPLRPRDVQALDAIPATWLKGAPNQPGHFLMGYREDGTCPMLSAGKCSIYAQRPQTCRDYDCRVFAAAGMDAGGPEKHVINQRVREWRFTYDSNADRVAQRALQTAAAFIKEKSASFPQGWAPTSPSGIAVLAAKTYSVFLDGDIHQKCNDEIALAIMQASRQFDSGCE